MYILLFILGLLLYLWFMSYREGLDEGVTSVDATPVPLDASVTPPSSISTCDSMNAQNKADMDALTDKVNGALNLSTRINTMEQMLQQNTTRIDTIINTQLTALINGRR